MSVSFKSAVDRYVRADKLASNTREDYQTTLRKWRAWGGGVPIERLDRKKVREFLDWVYDQAVADGGSNPGRTANKAREQLRAVVSWAWEHDLIDSLPRFPMPMPQRDVAGRDYPDNSKGIFWRSRRSQRAPSSPHSSNCRAFARSALHIDGPWITQAEIC